MLELDIAHTCTRMPTGPEPERLQASVCDRCGRGGLDLPDGIHDACLPQCEGGGHEQTLNRAMWLPPWSLCTLWLQDAIKLISACALVDDVECETVMLAQWCSMHTESGFLLGPTWQITPKRLRGLVGVREHVYRTCASCDHSLRRRQIWNVGAPTREQGRIPSKLRPTRYSSTLSLERPRGDLEWCLVLSGPSSCSYNYRHRRQVWFRKRFALPTHEWRCPVRQSDLCACTLGKHLCGVPGCQCWPRGQCVHL